MCWFNEIKVYIFKETNYLNQITKKKYKCVIKIIIIIENILKEINIKEVRSQISKR